MSIQSLRPIILTALFITCIKCWGTTGHKVIGEIGQTFVLPQVYEKLKIWLGDRNFSDVALDPDIYRNYPDSAWSAPLHYSDMPFPVLPHWNYSLGCVDDICVVGAILNYTKLVQSQHPTTTPPAIPPSALSFLIHFVGDVHQPLHVSFLGDLGGNKIPILFDLNPNITNLHSVWDNLLVDFEGKNWLELSQQLILELQSNPNLVQEYAKDLDPSSWAEESYQIVLTSAYNFNYAKRDYPIYIGEAYIQRNIPVVITRLMQAGVRLAATLNKILS